MTRFKTLLIAFFLPSSVAIADSYAAPLQVANWKVKKGESYCQLNQNIPLYGMAGFMHQSGDLLRFSIREDRYKADIVKASLSIENPLWRHDALDTRDYLVFLDKAVDIQNIPRLSVYGENAELMLDALSNGLSPTFSYVRASMPGLLPATEVSISAINFSKNYQQFTDCRKAFLPYGLKDVLERSLFFKAKSQWLNATILMQLKDIARYIKEVKGAKIVIVSDTAVAGAIDKRWFLKRAKVITDKLSALGVASSKVDVKKTAYTASNNKTIRLSIFGPDALTLIYYRKGRVKLNSSEKQRLNLIVKYTQGFMPNAKVVIKSHTDGKGRRAANLKVSQRRGDEIKRYLLSQGMAEGRLIVKAFGETRPVKSNRFPTGRAKNRRVIIDLVG